MEPPFTMIRFSEISVAQFLQDYWQQKPLLIKGGLAFEDLLEADELAGLAMDDMVESRVISKVDGKWSADFGPFNDYEKYGEQNWSLVIQALNHWVPNCEWLIQQFDFLPRWRFDDVMASFATKGGSVGPHTDKYDTFICQGSGSRHWRVGDNLGQKQFQAHQALLHTESFDPIIDEILEAGDVLYIPPGFPHEGISKDTSMSFSVGYRTNETSDMFSGLADFIIDQQIGQEQIEDPNRPISKNPGAINDSDFNRIKQQLFNMLSDDVIRDFSGAHLTQSKCELDLPEQESDISLNELIEELEHQPLVRLAGLRCLYFDEDPSSVFVNGQKVKLPLNAIGFVALICDHQALNKEQLAGFLQDEQLAQQFLEWVKLGFWYFEE